jgi:hypothetical protein
MGGHTFVVDVGHISELPVTALNEIIRCGSLEHFLIHLFVVITPSTSGSCCFVNPVQEMSIAPDPELPPCS